MTRRQSEAFAFIRAYIAENGFSPSYTDIMAALGMKSKAQAHHIVNALHRRGKITMVPGHHRSIELVREAAA